MLVTRLLLSSTFTGLLPGLGTTVVFLPRDFKEEQKCLGFSYQKSHYILEWKSSWPGWSDQNHYHLFQLLSFSFFLYHCGFFSPSSSFQEKVAILGSATHSILGSSLSPNHVLLFKKINTHQKASNSSCSLIGLIGLITWRHLFAVVTYSPKSVSVALCKVLHIWDASILF